MGKLINVGPGEQCDRLTVLSLKVLFGTDAGKDVAHFERERSVLLTQVRARAATLDLGPVLELAAVNSALWHAEDDLRSLRGAVPTDAVMVQAGLLAFRIQDLNDQRAKLVGEINARSGEASGEEKLT